MRQDGFRCPVCGEALIKNERFYSCKNNHLFDIAAQGYVNLLQCHSHDAGDDKKMVDARTSFLSKGYYEPLCKKLKEICVRLACKSAVFVDSGCGEGYYTNSIANTLYEADNACEIYGLDISKAAVKKAAKNAQHATFCVASAFNLPFADESADIVLNCFSPQSTHEFFRILRTGGKYIFVAPAPKHLWQMKQTVYETPYENEPASTNIEGFSICEKTTVDFDMNLCSNEDIENLFCMTPYFWKTSKEDAQKLSRLSSLTTRAAFDIYIFHKM